MLRPDSVRRVNPPTTRMPKTRVEQPKSHLGRERGRTGVGWVNAAVVKDREEEKNGWVRWVEGVKKVRVVKGLEVVRLGLGLDLRLGA